MPTSWCPDMPLSGHHWLSVRANDRHVIYLDRSIMRRVATLDVVHTRLQGDSVANAIADRHALTVTPILRMIVRLRPYPDTDPLYG